MLGRVFILLTLLLSACASPEFQSRFDGGGYIHEYQERIAELEAAGIVHRVAYACMSSCTLYLGLSTACFHREGVLGFHSPYLPDGRVMSDEQFERFTTDMAHYYPPRIAKWWMEVGRHSKDIITIPVSELIDRGEVKEC